MYIPLAMPLRYLAGPLPFAARTLAAAMAVSSGLYATFILWASSALTPLELQSRLGDKSLEF